MAGWVGGELGVVQGGVGCGGMRWVRRGQW